MIILCYKNGWSRSEHKWFVVLTSRSVNCYTSLMYFLSRSNSKMETYSI